MKKSRRYTRFELIRQGAKTKNGQLFSGLVTHRATALRPGS
jgi:hypothetical protein